MFADMIVLTLNS